MGEQTNPRGRRECAYGRIPAGAPGEGNQCCAARPATAGVQGRARRLPLHTSYLSDGAPHPASGPAARSGRGRTRRPGLAPGAVQSDEVGLILLALASRGPTWDLIVGRGRYGPDVAVIDRVLESTFNHYAVDPARVAVGGFSDGASYALSLGITNGDLFTHVLAFSSGFMVPAGRRGSPRVFVSHGTRDEVLPIDRCSRRIVPQLERAGYDIRYREFEGGHAVPSDVAREAIGWFVAPV